MRQQEAEPPVVRLGRADEALLRTAAREARAAAPDVAAAIGAARRLGTVSPPPGDGRTADAFAVLATLGAIDLTVARVVEPHLDALAILAQAGAAAEPGSAYGVYAAERPGLPPVAAEQEGEGFLLTGTKPWCSLAGRLDRALVTAVQEGRRRLFDLDLRHPGATAVPGAWVARGLAEVDSGDLVLDRVPARAVGEPDWYLRRPEFAWGGIGVAAAWFGGAVGTADALVRAAGRRAPDQIGLAALGEADRWLHAGRCVLEDAARRIDSGGAQDERGSRLALQVRGVVADAAERVLRLTGHALGPAPLAFDEPHARRVADLTLYVRQHHAARDDERAGRLLLDDPA